MWTATSTPPRRASFGSRYPFGLDATGGTFLCTAENEWVTAAPLIGVRTLRAACDASQQGKAAQSVDGQPMICDGLAWSCEVESPLLLRSTLTGHATRDQ